MGCCLDGWVDGVSGACLGQLSGLVRVWGSCLNWCLSDGQLSELNYHIYTALCYTPTWWSMVFCVSACCVRILFSCLLNALMFSCCLTAPLKPCLTAQLAACQQLCPPLPTAPLSPALRLPTAPLSPALHLPTAPLKLSLPPAWALAPSPSPVELTIVNSSLAHAELHDMTQTHPRP